MPKQRFNVFVGYFKRSFAKDEICLGEFDGETARDALEEAFGDDVIVEISVTDAQGNSTEYHGTLRPKPQPKKATS